MRTTFLLSLAALLSAPALAWVPKLEETTAKNVIDGAYGRRDPVPTYQTVDLNVKDGQFVSGAGAVKAFDGGDRCVADWLAAPTDFRAGSRPLAITASGQADQLYFSAIEARDSFKNMTAQNALAAFGAGYLPSPANNFGQTAAAPAPGAAPSPAAQSPALADGLLRIDVQARGLPTQKARDAYDVRLRGADGKLQTPARRSFVSDWKEDAGTWSGTLVYYFEPLKAGLGASDKAELLIRTEADTNCSYSVTLDLASFQ